MKRKIALTLALLVVSLGMVTGANAQKGKSFKGVDWKKMAEAARRGETTADKSIVARVDAAYAEKSEVKGENLEAPFSGGLVGTWYCTVPGPTPEDTFYAYQTFGADGTFVETSSLLGALPEGPAHGVYERIRRGYVLTFELFVFDQSSGGAAVGRVRVRNSVQLNDRDHFTSEYVVDFIEFDGTVIPNIGAGTFSGERVQLRGIE